MASKPRRTLRQAYEKEPVTSELAEFVFGSLEQVPQNGQADENSVESIKPGTEVVVSVSQIQKTFSFTPDGKPVRYFYDLEELKHWAETDLKPNGVRSPLWTRPMPGESEQYELVAGLRRLTGCELVGITEVPIKVFNWNDAQAYAAAFDENDRRQNFSALEDLDITLNLLAIKLEKTREEVISLLYRMDNEAKGKVKSTQSTLGKQDAQFVEEFFRSRDSISWQSFVSSRLPLLRKPEDILDAVRQSKIDYTKALEIAKLKDPNERTDFLQQAIAENLSLLTVKGQVKTRLTEAKADRVEGQQREQNLQARLNTIFKRTKRANWKDTDKAARLEHLLTEIEGLL